MKHVLLTLSLAAACVSSAEASHKTKCCKTSEACCPTTRWYKAKDGTYREMIPYADALSRAEDADDMEIALRGVRDELAAAVAATEAAKAQAADMQAAMEARIAELTSQLEAGNQQIAAQTERADNAEAAHKLSVETVAQLRDEAKRDEENLSTVRAELKTTAEERDALKSVNDLLAAAKQAAEDARKTAEEELARVKQDAAESKKAEVVDDEKKDETPEPPADGEQPAADAPVAPEAPAVEN